jgi:hypothetical protein
MSLPGFTAENSLYQTSDRYRPRNAYGNSRYDAVIPQYTCGYTRCFCSGFYDCAQMAYGGGSPEDNRGICWPGSLSCSYRDGVINCNCVPAIV